MSVPATFRRPGASSFRRFGSVCKKIDKNREKAPGIIEKTNAR
jgi:hypothetical protein